MARSPVARRRAGLIAAALAIIAVAAFLLHRHDGASAHADGPVSVQVEPIGFDRADPDRTRFGALIWRGGLRLSGEAPFGGLSGLVLSADGSRLTAVTDQGDWVTGRLDYSDGRLTGLSDVIMRPIEGAPGERLRNKSDKDAEGLAVAGEDEFLVSFERRHRIARYSRHGEGEFGQAAYLKVPEAIADLPNNRGLEAVGLVPGSDTVAAIAERALDEAGNHSGWLISPDGGGERFAISRSDGFDITDLAFLPDGDLILLERRFGLFLGSAFRLRRVARDDLRPGALIEGRVLFTTDNGYRVDNMEGLAVHQGKDGETVLTLVSDDNFSAAQATLLLQFALAQQ